MLFHPCRSHRASTHRLLLSVCIPKYMDTVRHWPTFRIGKMATIRNIKSWLISLVTSNWWKEHSAVSESGNQTPTRLKHERLSEQTSADCFSTISYKCIGTIVNNAVSCYLKDLTHFQTCASVLSRQRLLWPGSTGQATAQGFSRSMVMRWAADTVIYGRGPKTWSKCSSRTWNWTLSSLWAVKIFRLYKIRRIILLQLSNSISFWKE